MLSLDRPMTRRMRIFFERRTLTAVSVAGVAVAFALPGAASANVFSELDEPVTVESGPTISIATDKADYSPGELVTVTGSGWQAGESVAIAVVDDGVAEERFQYDAVVTADEHGDVVDRFNIAEWYVAEYFVTATGEFSGVATTSFTDSLTPYQEGDTAVAGIPACTNASSARVSDDQRASCERTLTTASGTDVPGQAVVVSGFDLQDVVPVGATNIAFNVEVEARKSAGSTSRPLRLALSGNGGTTFTPTGSGFADTANFSSETADQIRTFPTAAPTTCDAFNKVGGWAWSELSNANFKVRLTPAGGTGASQEHDRIDIDQVRVRACYDGVDPIEGAVSGRGAAVASPSGTVQGAVQVHLSGTTDAATPNWLSTGYQFENLSGPDSVHCVDTTDRTGRGIFIASFPMTAPPDRDVYKVHYRVYSSTNCAPGTELGAPLDVFTLNEALTVGIFGDSFGIGNDNSYIANGWTDGDPGGASCRVEGTAGGLLDQDSYLRLRQGCTQTRSNISTAGLENIHLKYRWGQQTNEVIPNGLVVQWKKSSAASWTTVGSHTLADSNTSIPNSADVDLGDSADDTSIDIRLTGVTVDSTDLALVDDVLVTGDAQSAKQDQTITFDQPADATYGDADVDPGATSDSGLTVGYASNSGSVCTIVSGNIHIVGVGTCSVTASQPGNDDYNAATDVTRTFEVDPAELSIDADDDSKEYGDSDPSPLGYSLSGFVNGENAGSAGVTGDAVCSIDPAAGPDAGEYPDAISCAAGSLAAANYSFATGDLGKFTIDKAPLEATVSDESITYGDSVPAFSVSSWDAFKGSDDESSSVTGTLSCDSTSGHGVAGSPHPVSCSGLDSDNYDITYTGGSLTVDPAELSVNADNKSMTYNGSPPTLTYSLSGFKNGEDKNSAGVTGDANCSIDPSAGPDAGEYPGAITCVPGSLAAANYSFATGDAGKLTITPAGTTIVYSGDTTKQYSDKAHLKATLTSGGNPLAGKTVTFKLGSQDFVSDDTDANGVAELDLKVDQAPATTFVVARFAGTQNYGQASTGAQQFIVTQEDARIQYTGLLSTSTSSPTSNTATVTSTATIRDITAVYPGLDADAGDIRKAKVDFIVDNNVVCNDVGVGLVTASDMKVGTATCNWIANLGSNNDALNYTVGTRVEGWYTRDKAYDNVVVNVSKPIASAFITGGGYLVNQSSAGLYAGDAGERTNFGFNVKYNKAGTNLQGSINAIMRKGTGVYQVKGNAMNSLTSKVTGSPKTATFTGKANIQNITDPQNVQPIDGNATLQVTMSDYGEPGTGDKIGITVLNKSGGLWFASAWSGTQTLEQLLGGGNLQAR